MAFEGYGHAWDGFRLELSSGGVLTLTLDRPDAGNALPSAAIPQLADVFEQVAIDPDVRALLVRGEGDNFCVGGDVKGFALTINHTAEERHADYHARMDRARRQVTALAALPCPIVVACQGAVAGAAVAYPLAADIALAEPGTRFVFPHQRLGLPPDGGLSYFLPRMVGVRKASELALTAATIDAEEALRLGIISRIVAAEELQQAARQLADRVAALPPDAVRRTRDLLRASVANDLDMQLRAERDAVAEAVATDAFVGGVRKFMGSRAAAPAK
ncbi:enoyl-CoA hydratase/isomerase family protein [Sphingomonas sp.]|jgi:2-(1,2-epoxy-1,2-dihydrophenyl)acetyl-CoA isomerase|uniref:enoyl-CoA hydratase/isomerase family protein n=1 Tax=Sphingomonadales TaxID=204457 RepID=UPI0035C863E6